MQGETQGWQFCSSFNDTLPHHATMPVLRENVCSQAFLRKARSGETSKFEDFGFFVVGERQYHSHRLRIGLLRFPLFVYVGD